MSEVARPQQIVVTTSAEIRLVCILLGEFGNPFGLSGESLKCAMGYCGDYSALLSKLIALGMVFAKELQVGTGGKMAWFYKPVDDWVVVGSGKTLTIQVPPLKVEEPKA